MHPLERLQTMTCIEARVLTSHMDEGDLDPTTCMWLDFSLYSNYVKKGWSPVQGIVST